MSSLWGLPHKKVDCRLLFDRLRTKIAESRIETRSGELGVTVSIGVARAAAGSTVDTLLETADRALYQAKDNGRNRVAQNGRCFFEKNK